MIRISPEPLEVNGWTIYQRGRFHIATGPEGVRAYPDLVSAIHECSSNWGPPIVEEAPEPPE